MGGIVIKLFAFVLILGCEKISHLPVGFSPSPRLTHMKNNTCATIIPKNNAFSNHRY